MGKRSVVTQELANAFPEWSKIRLDQDSNGQRLLNCFANEIEDLEDTVFKIGKNVPSHQRKQNVHPVFSLSSIISFTL